jgi:hypothetical protein
VGEKLPQNQVLKLLCYYNLSVDSRDGTLEGENSHWNVQIGEDDGGCFNVWKCCIIMFDVMLCILCAQLL